MGQLKESLGVDIDDPSIEIDGAKLMEVFARAYFEEDWPGQPSIRHELKAFLMLRFTPAQRHALYLGCLRLVQQGALPPKEDSLLKIFLEIMGEKNFKALLPEAELILTFTRPPYPQMVRSVALSTLAQAGYTIEGGWRNHSYEDDVFLKTIFLGIQTTEGLSAAMDWLIEQSENELADKILIRAFPTLKKKFPQEALLELQRYVSHLESLPHGTVRARQFDYHLRLAKTLE